MVQSVGKGILIEILHCLLATRHFIEQRDLRHHEVYKAYLPSLNMAVAGQEIAMIVPCLCLRHDDYLMPFVHRGVPSALGKGADARKLMADALARSGGYAKAQNRFVAGDPAIGLLTSAGLVGPDIAVGTGAGLAAHVRGSDQVVAVFFGEGTSNKGEFHESINLAAMLKLPVVYLVINNEVSQTTAADYVLPTKNVADRAAAYAIPGKVVDGNDAFVVYEATKEAVERARSGEGPSLLELKTSKLAPDEVWSAKDCVAQYRDILVGEQIVTEEEVRRMDKTLVREMQEAVKFAENSPSPTRDELMADIW